MGVGVTSVGPLRPETRDELADFRDENGHPNYEEALSALLAEASG